MKKVLFIILFILYSSFVVAQTNEIESSPFEVTNNSTNVDYDNDLIDNIVSWFKDSVVAIHPPTVAIAPNKVIVGLALGGGAAKGFAHIGVIKALVENGINVQIVTGTSAGSVVGSLYAYGYTPQQLEKMGASLDILYLADFTINKNGIIKGAKLQNFINQSVKNTQLQKLKLKFIAVATNLDSGQSIGFNTGNTGAAVRASCAIPNVFLHVLINHKRYVDGGLSAPVPVSYARKAGAQLVIAVDITTKPNQSKASGFLSNFDQSINIMSASLLNEQLSQADFVISPDISKLSSFSFDQKKRAIDLGYKATMAQIPQIKAKILLMQQTIIKK